jgi:hypothetical protein
MRGDLEHRLHELGLDLAVGRVLEQRLDGVGEVAGLRVEDHQLLLDPERVTGTGEVRLHVAWEGSQL